MSGIFLTEDHWNFEETFDDKFERMKLDELKKKYYEKYQVLELCKDTKDKYTWINEPWPWDGGYNV